jgi:hypothetical protein
MIHQCHGNPPIIQKILNSSSLWALKEGNWHHLWQDYFAAPLQVFHLSVTDCTVTPKQTFSFLRLNGVLTAVDVWIATNELWSIHAIQREAHVEDTLRYFSFILRLLWMSSSSLVHSYYYYSTPRWSIKRIQQGDQTPITWMEPTYQVVLHWYTTIGNWIHSPIYQLLMQPWR